ncbi:TPA: aldehyde dehydrogenase family protein [Bacillus cereus]|nr:aldehyde dehydrogenase family protein [Bacillus cereus]
MNGYFKIYINGQFVKPLVMEKLELINPANKQATGKVVLGNVEVRLERLSRLHESLSQRFDRLTEVVVSEYSAPVTVAKMLTQLAINALSEMKEVIQSYPFIRAASTAKVQMEPIGVVGVITPWNANATHLVNKIGPALSEGCTGVFNPSEFSAVQTEVFMEAVHAVNIQAGRISVNGVHNERKASFGGFKSSVIGKEHGTYGIEECLESKAILGHNAVI